MPLGVVCLARGQRSRRDWNHSSVLDMGPYSGLTCEPWKEQLKVSVGVGGGGDK